MYDAQEWPLKGSGLVSCQHSSSRKWWMLMNFFSLINGVYNMPALWLTARRLLRSMSVIALGTPTRNPPTLSTPGSVYVGASNDADDSAPGIATSASSLDALGGRLSSYADYIALPWTRIGHRDTPRNTFRNGGPKLKATRTTGGQEEFKRRGLADG